jgi:excisionase family DNA binding protein
MPSPEVSRARSAGDVTSRRLVSIAKAAEAQDVSTRTMRRWIAEGRIRGYRVGPRLVKIDVDDLNQLARRIPTAG